MARLRLQDGDLVQVHSRRGDLVLPAVTSDSVAPTQAHVAMHWGGEVLGAGVAGGINTLTNPAFCPLSKQPELKHTAVRLKKADLPWRLLAAAWLPEDDALALRQALQPLMAGFGYASAVPFGHARHGVLLRLAAADPASAETVAAIETLFGLGPDRRDALRYADPRRGQRRAIGLEIVGSDTRLQAFVLAGDIRAEAWIKDLLQQQLPAQAFGRQLLRPDATAPVGALDVVARGAGTVRVAGWAIDPDTPAPGLHLPERGRAGHRRRAGRLRRQRWPAPAATAAAAGLRDPVRIVRADTAAPGGSHTAAPGQPGGLKQFVCLRTPDDAFGPKLAIS